MAGRIHPNFVEQRDTMVPEDVVFAAAVERFAALGVRSAQLSDIAREAGVSVASLEREFGTKENLFRAAVRFVAQRHVARACGELPPGCAVDQLRNFCGRGWEIFHTPTYAALYRLWVTEVPRSPEYADLFAEEVFAGIHRILTQIIERGVAEGTFRPVASHAAARVIHAGLVTQAFWCLHGESLGLSHGADCSRVVADTLSLVLSGLQPTPPSNA